jgi:hypothetical protein
VRAFFTDRGGFAGFFNDIRHRSERMDRAGYMVTRKLSTQLVQLACLQEPRTTVLEKNYKALDNRYYPKGRARESVGQGLSPFQNAELGEEFVDPGSIPSQRLGEIGDSR